MNYITRITANISINFFRRSVSNANYFTPPHFRKQSDSELSTRKFRYAAGISGALITAYFVPWAQFVNRIFFPDDGDED